jgi:hypothetical protein
MNKYLSLEERSKISKDLFGDPVRQLFPILSQEDVDKAPKRISVIDNAEEVKQNIINIAQKNNYMLPTTWVTNYSSDADFSSSAEFDLGVQNTVSQDNGDYVLRTGKIFEAGNYPDKKFDITPEEMCEAIADFKPVPLDIEHGPSIMDGKIGTLEAVALDADGKSLVGTVKVPKWFDDNVFKHTQRKVSATWDRATKKLNKLALVLNPRIKDAAMLSEEAGLFAAFVANEYSNELEGYSKDELEAKIKSLLESAGFDKQTWDGKYLMQSIHDTASRSGAVCHEDEKTFNEAQEAGFLSKAESDVIQQIHDVALRGGAVCKFLTVRSESSEYTDNREKIMLKELKAFFNRLPEDFDLENLEAFKKEADEASIEAKVASLEEREQKLAEAEKAFAEKEASLGVKDEKVVEETAEEKDEVENSVASERERQLEAELEAFRNKDVAREAEIFADAEIRAGRAFPAERAAMIALFSQAYKDDRSSDVKIKFKSGEEEVEVDRVETIKAIYASRKPHELTYEHVENFGVNVLDTEFGEDDSSGLGDAVEQARKFAARRNREFSTAGK